MKTTKRWSPIMSVLVLGSLLLGGIGCGERDKSKRERQSLGANGVVPSSSPQAQNQFQQSQIAAQQYNIDARWEDISEPLIEGQVIEVLSTLVYNGTYYQVNSTHSALGTSRPTTFTGNYNLSDGTSLTSVAICSDQNCSQYAITYNFKKGGADAIQHLVWVDFTQTSAPRIHSTTGGQFWDINTWYNFASNTNNFLDP